MKMTMKRISGMMNEEGTKELKQMMMRRWMNHLELDCFLLTRQVKTYCLAVLSQVLKQKVSIHAKSSCVIVQVV